MRALGLALGALLLAPAAVRAAEPDVTMYERLLRAHLATLRSDGRPLATGFDYTGIHERPGAQAVMSVIRRQLLAVPPSAMKAGERTAWAIDLYNFLVIDRVLTRLQTNGALPASVRDVPGFFDRPAVYVEGHGYSLDELERVFLFGGRDPHERPSPGGVDPRIHFALVCGARGCPPLAARAYRAATLDRDLDRVTREALASPVHLRTEARTGRLEISSIFDWYASDFGGRDGVRAFLVRYAPAPAAAAIRRRGADAIGGFIPWDWRLNQVDESLVR